MHEHSVGVARSVAVPGDEEAAVARHRQGGVLLIAGGRGVDRELGTERVPCPRVALAEDTLAASVLQIARPGNREVAAGVDGDGGPCLGVRGERVDEELATDGAAVGGIALGVDTREVAVLDGALPGDDEASIGSHGDVAVQLVVARRRADAELDTDPVAERVEALSVDAPATAVLQQARPRDHEVAVRVHRDRGELLVVVDVGVDLQLTAEGSSGGVVHPRPHTRRGGTTDSRRP